MDEIIIRHGASDPKNVISHYGHNWAAVAYARGFWPRENFVKRLSKLGEFVELDGLTKKKFRIVIDYDTEFPIALVQVFCPPPQSSGR